MAGNNITLVDINGEKLARLLSYKKLDRSELSENMGYHAAFISNAISRNKINKSAIAFLEKIYEIPYEDYKPGTEEKVEAVTQVVQNSTDLTPVIERLDKLIEAINNLAEIEQVINRIGNIQMQNLEYNKTIMNDVNSSNSELKKLNDKWNKPGAYRK